MSIAARRPHSALSMRPRARTESGSSCAERRSASLSVTWGTVS
ncbi:MAG TPA: hypothetical protein VM387_02620 [Gemmatimonadales bacterium]|nr:hypothetical protein [Gemmatimonadales bacterium]